MRSGRRADRQADFIPPSSNRLIRNAPMQMRDPAGLDADAFRAQVRTALALLHLRHAVMSFRGTRGVDPFNCD
jgi:hypothetical protein